MQGTSICKELDQFMPTWLLTIILKNSLFRLCEGFLMQGYIYAKCLINNDINTFPFHNSIFSTQFCEMIKLTSLRSSDLPKSSAAHKKSNQSN